MEFDELKNVDITIGDGQRKTRIIKEDGLVKMGQSFYVKDAVKTVEKMGQMARHTGTDRKAETRVAAVLHEGQLQEIANKYQISVIDLISKQEYQKILWDEGTGRDYSKMRIHE